MSLPTRERGLKYKVSSLPAAGVYVAPYTGAWIEIVIVYISNLKPVVAPYTGAWIEIGIFDAIFIVFSGRSLHGSVD